MDKNFEILFGANKNVNSIAVDNYDKFTLENKRNNLLEYDVRNVLSVTEVFEAERQGTEVYRIYGGIEYLSILNGLDENYSELVNFFQPFYCTGGTCAFKDIYDSFNFYLVRPFTGYTNIELDESAYIRQFEVIATPDDFDLFNAGYSKNVYNEDKFEFMFTKDFNVAGMVDEFGFPPTELYLYAQYNPATNSNGSETMKRREWGEVSGETQISGYTPTPLIVGDVIQGDKIDYFPDTFTQMPLEDAQYYIRTKYNYAWGSRWLQWKYNPFIPFKLRYFSQELRRANTGGTSYDQSTNIPYYATDLGDGNYVWRDILKQGYIDPLTGNGVEYPFVNKRRYLFSNVIFFGPKLCSIK